jgi:MFS family permease
MTQNPKSSPSIPSSIWALGSVSFLMKISSTIVFTLSPLFVTQVLGASIFTLGILEAVIEAITFTARIFSGVLSDLIHKRKSIIAVAYIFALISRPLLALATRLEDIVLGRAFDRIANGLDATPRDALVGDLAPPQIKGACYGLRESLSRAGSFAGALLVMGLLWLTAGNFSLIFWLNTIPTALALIVLLLFVKDPTSEKFQQKKIKKKFDFKELFHLPLAFWLTLLLSGLFMLSNFSGAFLILRVEQTGLDLYLIPLVMIIQNFATASTAYPIGYLSDRMGRRSMMALGILFVILSNLLLAWGSSIYMILGGVLLWGVEIGITQSMLAVFLADSCPEDVRGTGFGLFHFINGICLLLANIFAGWIWHASGPSSMFYTSAVVATASAFVLLFIKRKASTKVAR